MLNFYDQTLYPINTGAGSNPGSTYTSPLAFAPVFYFACKRSSVPGVDDAVITLQAEVNYYFTFRNPKFGGTSFDTGMQASRSMAREIAAGTLVNSAARQPALDQSERMDDVGDDEEEGNSPESLRRLEAMARTGMLVDDEEPLDPETVSLDASTTSSSGRATKRGNKKQHNMTPGETPIFNEDTKPGFDPKMTLKRSETMDAKSSKTTTTSKK